MINVAEEVRQPERVFPRAILTAVIVCGVMYATVSSIALLVVPVAELSQADAPLVAVVQRAAPAIPPLLFTVIALIAVANTGLLNAVMASRLIYGMSRQGMLPNWLSAVHPRTQTPHRAVLTIFASGLVLAFSGTLTQLAETTSLLLLIVFATINGAAIWIRRRDADDHTGFRVPTAIPVLAIVNCVGLGAFVSRVAFLTGAAVVGVGVVLMFVFSRQISRQALSE